PVDVARVGDVGAHRERLATRAFDLGDGGVRARVVTAVAERHRVPLARERDARCRADSLRTTGHERGARVAHRSAHRINALAQVIPAPKPHINTRSPGLTRPSSTASNNASGIDADEVFP